jgi:hypothetical protein
MFGFQKRALKIGFDCFFSEGSPLKFGFPRWDWSDIVPKVKKGLRAARHNEAFSRQAHK